MMEDTFFIVDLKSTSKFSIIAMEPVIGSCVRRGGHRLVMILRGGPNHRLTGHPSLVRLSTVSLHHRNEES